MSGFRVINGYTDDVLTLAEVKNHLRVDFAEDDNLIGLLTKSAINQVESMLERKLITSDLEYFLDGFPVHDSSFELPYYKVSEITSIKYYNENDTLVLWDGGEYDVDVVSFRSRVSLNEEKSFPVTNKKLHSVVVLFKSGAPSASEVEEDIKLALLLIIADMYERREDRVSSLPKASSALLQPYRPLEVS